CGNAALRKTPGLLSLSHLYYAGHKLGVAACRRESFGFFQPGLKRRSPSSIYRKERPMRQTPRHHLVGPAIMAIALALPVAGALAETFDAVVVHTRSLNTNADGLGRAGGSAFVDNRDATLEAQQAQAGAAAWDKTKAEAASAWNRTKAFVAQKPAVPVDEPQRYGRAGGFIGAEQFEVPQ